MREEQSELAAALDTAQSHNTELAAIAARYGALLDHARDQLSGLLAEYEAPRAGYERVVRP
jgi:hypothetical protein